NKSIDKTIYIGDSEVDIQTAKNAGIPCISVSWGFKSLEFLKENGAKVIVNNAKEIIDFIDNN
ncbi:MAG: HAD hydrolase-like protein, partial [Treponema sp.]|nr:HAD hydrolase-like protein [Treponema sp.]